MCATRESWRLARSSSSRDVSHSLNLFSFLSFISLFSLSLIDEMNIATSSKGIISGPLRVRFYDKGNNNEKINKNLTYILSLFPSLSSLPLSLSFSLTESDIIFPWTYCDQFSSPEGVLIEGRWTSHDLDSIELEIFNSVSLIIILSAILTFFLFLLFLLFFFFFLFNSLPF